MGSATQVGRPSLTSALHFSDRRTSLTMYARRKAKIPSRSSWHRDASALLHAAVLVQDFVAGCFGGAAQLITGHPFDTIKVSQHLMQPASPFSLVMTSVCLSVNH